VIHPLTPVNKWVPGWPRIDFTSGKRRFPIITFEKYDQYQQGHGADSSSRIKLEAISYARSRPLLGAETDNR
tara:strand:- start:197 stop:412 length:216 start_codon:yes stop_codon:yes gene_type:complete